MDTTDVLHPRKSSNAHLRWDAVLLDALSVRAARAWAHIVGKNVRSLFSASAGCVIAALLSIASAAQAVDYTVTVKTTSPVVLSELLSQTTTGFFLGTSKKSTTFANTWAVTITGLNPNAPGKCPPDYVSAQELLNALISISSSTYPYGWGNGMEYERSENIDWIYGMQGYDYANKTIGGKPVTGGFTIPELLGSTVPVAGFERKYVSTDTVHLECLGMYNAIVSTITIKNFGPPPVIPGF